MKRKFICKDERKSLCIRLKTDRYTIGYLHVSTVETSAGSYCGFSPLFFYFRSFASKPSLLNIDAFSLLLFFIFDY